MTRWGLQEEPAEWADQPYLPELTTSADMMRLPELPELPALPVLRALPVGLDFVEETVSRDSRSSSWVFGPGDLAIAAGMLAVSLSICVPAALQLRAQVRNLDRQREAVVEQGRQARSTLEYAEGQRVAFAQMRREVKRYVTHVEAKPIVPWATAISELSRRRPRGVWTTRISGSGPQFRAQVVAKRPELLAAYTQQLRESPFVDYAAQPSGEAPTTVAQIVGRWTGE